MYELASDPDDPEYLGLNFDTLLAKVKSFAFRRQTSAHDSKC